MNKSGALTIIIVLFLLTIIIGCSNQTWEVKTIQKISQSRGTDGGFTSFENGNSTDTTTDFFSTYYFISLEQLLGINSSYTETYDFLVNSMKSTEISKPGELYNIYFAVKIMEKIGKYFPEEVKKNIVKQLQKVYNKTGFYGSTEVDISLKVLNTYLAIDILKTFKQQPSKDTIDWLVDVWKNDNYFNLKEPYAFSKVTTLIKGLALTGVEIAKLEKFNERLNWIRSQEQVIISPKTIAQYQSNVIFDLNEATEINKILKIERLKLPSESIKALKARQLRDGGFNEISTNFSEPQSTYFAFKILNEQHENVNNLESVKVWIEKAKTKSGYRLVVYRKSSYYTTYAALVSLNKLGRKNIVYGELESFLLHANSSEQNLREQYFRLLIFKKLNLPTTNLNPSKPMTSLSIEEIYYYLEGEAIQNNSISYEIKKQVLENISRLQKDSKRFGTNKLTTIKEIFYTVQIYRILGFEGFDKGSIAGWLKKQQQHDGGFSENGEISDMKSTFFASSALTVLGEKPEDVSRLLKWLDSCKENDGGYKFASLPINHPEADDAKPDLLPTFWALQVKSLYN